MRAFGIEPLSDRTPRFPIDPSSQCHNSQRLRTARAHYQLPASVAAGLISAIVQLRGFRHSEKRAILRALEIWASNPRLGFVDALTLAYVQAPGMQLATFDSDFDNLPGINRWQSHDVG
jgi:predicted nucleic acid-binding protein